MKQKFLKLIVNYFFIHPLQKFFFYCTIKFNKNFYCFLFNIYSFLFGIKTKIKYESIYYFLEENNKSWRFYHRHQGLMAYSNGLLKRGLQLRKEYLIEKINFYNDDEIIDCGANNGDFFLSFDKKINYTGLEPSKIEYSNLNYNIKNQTLINKALWKKSNSYLNFFVSGELADNSLIKISNYEETQKVSTITLDDIIDIISKKIKLVKIEAEGAEPEVLMGLKKNLNKVNYITIDCGFERGLKKESTLVKCVNYLLENNFKILDFSNNRVVVLFKNKLFK
jgi:FkbM family methyltransferase